VDTLVNFLEALIICWVIVLGAYLATRSVWWTVRFASWAILYATFGVTLRVVHPIWWVIRSLARFSQDANNIQSLCALSQRHWSRSEDYAYASATAGILGRRKLRQGSEGSFICARTTGVCGAV
jgi:hypothetical protein